MKAWGDSVIGPLHKKNKLPNQDAWAYRHYNWGSVVSVSDGLGSKKHSDLGAQQACYAVLNAASELAKFSFASHDQLVVLIHQIWLKSLGSYSPNDCAATCLFVVQFGDKVILGQLGDGLVAAMGNDGMYEHIAEDKSVGFSNLTACLYSDVMASDWKIIELSTKDFNRFLLCTDGISDDLPPESYEPFCKDFIDGHRHLSPKKRNKSIKKMLSGWPVSGHTDDKTIAVLIG